MSEATRLLIFSTFATKEMAEYVVKSINDAAPDFDVHIDALALVEKDQDGKVHYHEPGDLSARSGAIRGGIAGAVFGLIFPPSIIASVLIAGGIGALWAKLHDTGFSSADLNAVGADLQPGEFAVLFLGPESDRAFVHRYLADAKSVVEKTVPASLVDAIKQL